MLQFYEEVFNVSFKKLNTKIYINRAKRAVINGTGTTSVPKQNSDKNVLTCRQQYATRHQFLVDKESQSHPVTSAKSILTTIIIVSAYHTQNNAI